VILRCLWFCGYSWGCGSLKNEKDRAKIACDLLVEYAQEQTTVALVGHGFFNMLIAKELQKIIPAMNALLEYEWLTGKQFIEKEALDNTLSMIEKMGNIYENNQFDDAIALYKKNELLFAPGTSSIHKDQKKHFAKEKIIDMLYDMTFKGNKDAQQIMSDRLFNRIKINNEFIPCALEYLAFYSNLNTYEIPLEPQKESIKKAIIKMRNTPDCSQSIQYILLACRYLQSTTDAEKQSTSHMIIERKCPQSSRMEAICQFIINYGKNTISTNEAIKNFIHTIDSLKNTSQTLRFIAEKPLCDVIINKLHLATLDKNDVFLPDLNRYIAEIYYNDKQWIKSHEFFQKIDAEKLKEKKLVSFLESVKPDAAKIFIVGDLFDCWIEYRKVVPKGYYRLLAKLNEIVEMIYPK
jgi:hypothetical protein